LPPIKQAASCKQQEACGYHFLLLFVSQFYAAILCCPPGAQQAHIIAAEKCYPHALQNSPSQLCLLSVVIYSLQKLASKLLPGFSCSGLPDRRGLQQALQISSPGEVIGHEMTHAFNNQDARQRWQRYQLTNEG
jgi:hypothetical protein